MCHLGATIISVMWHQLCVFFFFFLTALTNWFSKKGPQALCCLIYECDPPRAFPASRPMTAWIGFSPRCGKNNKYMLLLEYIALHPGAVHSYVTWGYLIWFAPFQRGWWCSSCRAGEPLLTWGMLVYFTDKNREHYTCEAARLSRSWYIMCKGELD